MSFKKIILSFSIFIVYQFSNAQTKDPNELSEIFIKEFKTVNGIGHLSDSKDGIIYAGKKNEIILVDSLDANKFVWYY